MSDDHDLITRLDAHLQVPLSTPALREARALARQAERAGRRSGARRRGLVALVVAGGLALGGGAVAYGAPQTWMWLFPPASNHSVTFANGLTCTVDITIRADYSSVGSHGASPAAMQVMQRAADQLDLSTLDLRPYLDKARADVGSNVAESPHIVEHAALISAVYDEMMRVTGGPNGATWSSEASCD